MKDYRAELRYVVREGYNYPDETVNKIIALIKESLGENEEHSKDCVYVKVPSYFGNPAKEKYCTCGTDDVNQHRQEVKTNWGIK